MWKNISFLVLSSFLIIPANSNERHQFPTVTTIFSGVDNNFDCCDLDDDGTHAKIILTLQGIIRKYISPLGSDASLLVRLFALKSVAAFDAIAPYTPTAVGIHSNLGRRPPNERTNRNKNIANFYCSVRVLANALPDQGYLFVNLLKDLGLDPDDTHESTTDAVGIGNACGRAINEDRDDDGMNSKGNIGAKSQYNLKPFRDYTGYQPINTHDKLRDPRRWQPAIVDKNGIFQIQMYGAPQVAKTRPYSYSNASQFPTKPHGRLLEGSGGMELYKQTTDEVIAISTTLTDEQKLAAEFFDDKLTSLGYVQHGALVERNLTYDEFVFYSACHYLALFDINIVVWTEKTRWDAVRPFSAIKFLYGDKHITTYCGKGQGTCSDLPASDWDSYMSLANNPEYPSTAAAICATYAEVSRKFFGHDRALSTPVPFLQGSSRREPGITPRQNTSLSFKTWTDFEMDCAASRLWGGVHFVDAVEEGNRIGKEVGKLAYEFVTRHVYGIDIDKAPGTNSVAQ